MSSETMTVEIDADAELDEGNPTWNYGGDNYLIIGDGTPPYTSRILMKFTMPEYSGTIERIRLYFYIQIRAAFTMEAMILEAPQDDLWLEGTSSGAVDTVGCSWNEYLKAKSWDTAGGDFDVTPVGLEVFPGGAGQLWKYLEIPIENFDFQSGKTYTLLLKSTTEAVGHNFSIHSIENVSGNVPYMSFVIGVDGFEKPILEANTISSTQIDISWPESTLDDDNFLHYQLEQSDTGVGGWSTLATITDKETVSYQHTGVVVQGDVDDYDEDSDTYPNGRTKYYRLTLVSNGFGSPSVSDVVDATTVPAIRPVSLVFTPKSKYWEDGFIDDNKAYTPYGVEVVPSWYDALDITEEIYIDKLTVEAFFRRTSTWPGAASETQEYSPVDFGVGGIIEGDSGYKPYKIKGQIYDTGGLYRKATTDKTNEQFDVAWPAPCPVAIPDGPYTPYPPPEMRGNPFAAGDLVPVDLSIAGQQIGGFIYRELFTGLVTDTGKWGLAVVNATPFVYSTGVGGAPIMLSTHNGSFSTSDLFKVLRGVGGAPDNSYNKYMSKYTGGYSFKCIVRFDTNWDLSAGTQLFINLCTWKDHGIQQAGYSLQFVNGTDNLQVNQHGNFVADPVFLGAMPVASGDSPMKVANVGKFLYFEVIVSPYFGPSNEGDIITIIYNIDATLAGVQNIDYETHPYIFVVTSLVHNAADQQHYTGLCSIIANSSVATSQTNADFEIYLAEIVGRVEVGDYGIKNLTHEQTFGLVSSPIPTFQILCSPDQPSEVCYIEGRIKNQYGAQSRTGEVDDYQGDTFNNSDPTAVLIAPSTGYVDSALSFNGSLSSDPEGGVLIYEWDWDDGSSVETTDDAFNNHIYTSTGAYNVELRVQDEDGNWSAIDTKTVVIISGEFDTLSFICSEPFTEVSLIREDGDTETPVPGYAQSYYQNNKTGGRKFSVSGFTVECANLPDATLIANAQAEIDLLDALYKEGTPIILQLPVFGDIKGFISSFRPKVDDINPRFWTWTMTFKEFSDEQSGG